VIAVTSELYNAVAWRWWRDAGGLRLIINEEELAHALTGMVYPARRWQTIAWADFNCTSEHVRNALRELPELTYADFREVVEILRAIDQVGTGRRAQ
jgi:hypothetical protein